MPESIDPGCLVCIREEVGCPGGQHVYPEPKNDCMLCCDEQVGCYPTNIEGGGHLWFPIRRNEIALAGRRMSDYF